MPGSSLQCLAQKNHQRALFLHNLAGDVGSLAPLGVTSPFCYWSKTFPQNKNKQTWLFYFLIIIFFKSALLTLEYKPKSQQYPFKTSSQAGK